MKHRKKKNINEKSTYMNKKMTYDEVRAEILASFPGTIVKKGRKADELNKEQRVWLLNNVGKYSHYQIECTLGLTYYSQLKALSAEDPSYIKKYEEYKEIKAAEHKIWYLKRKQKEFAEVEEAKRRKRELKEAAMKPMKVNKPKKSEEPKEPKVWKWDIDENVRKYEEEQRKKAERKAALKAERAEDRLNHQCYLKRKDIERKPKPFSIDEQVLRQKAYDRYYILPDGEELFTDRRRCIYWDEDTKRSEELERKADELKFNVIEYRRMFPDKSNSLSSCEKKNEVFD